MQLVLRERDVRGAAEDEQAVHAAGGTAEAGEATVDAVDVVAVDGDIVDALERDRADGSPERIQITGKPPTVTPTECIVRDVQVVLEEGVVDTHRKNADVSTVDPVVVHGDIVLRSVAGCCSRYSHRCRPVTGCGGC